MKESQQQTRLNDQLAEFYGNIELPPSVLAEMLSFSDRPRPVVRRWVGMLGAAAAAVLMAFVGVALWGGGGGGRNIAELALAEVAENHLKGIAPEMVSPDYAVVQEHLSRLNFSIEPPAGGLVEGFDLIGGRYCKVQGVFAAQLKLRPRQGGSEATAYIVPAEGRLAVIDEASAVIYGVRVRCERSGDRLVFLAEAAPAN